VGKKAFGTLARAALAVGLAGGLAACGRGGAPAPAPEVAAAPLIARADLFGEPLRHSAKLSPRGDRIAFIAPRDGAPNVWVVSATAMDEPRPVTDDQDRGVREFWWSQDGANLFYLRASGAGAQLFVAQAAGGEERALTPEGARAEIVGLGPNDPGGIVVTLNRRDTNWPDLYRIDIASGERTLIYRNINNAAVRGFTRFVVDRDNRLRLGLTALPDGGAEVFARQFEGEWRSLFVIPFEDAMASRPIAFEADGRSFLMLDSTGRDRAALVRVDALSGQKTVLGESPRADVVDVWLDPATNAPEAFAAEYLRRDWRALDAEAQADLDYLDQQVAGEVVVTSRSLDDARWIVEESSPTSAPRSYLYDRSDRANRRLTLLFRHRPSLDAAPLQPMTPIEIEARDGLTLVSYLTLPVGSDANGDARPDTPAPLVIAARADPWGRDSHGYDAVHQWLANRGYAVLSVNFRGSAGLGKAFQNAGNREWGGRMQDDLLDAAQWAVETGIAQADRVAIMGGGYGGYAALAGLAFTPDRFRCAVAFSPPADLPALVEQTAAQANAQRDGFYLRVGDVRVAEMRQTLRDRSPVTQAGQIAGPLLLALGGEDSGVSRAALDQIAQSLRARQTPLIYLNYPNEGAQLVRVRNRLSFFAVAEHFLGECLGGRAEPVGAALEGANVQALEGAARAPGLSAFAPRPAAVRAAPAETPASGEAADALKPRFLAEPESGAQSDTAQPATP
jgi:dipeptidyl aminopeptidase/acylaminoacyl peptidase